MTHPPRSPTAIRRHLANRLEERRRELERRKAIESKLEAVNEEVKRQEAEEEPKSRLLKQLLGAQGLESAFVCYLGVCLLKTTCIFL